MSSTVKTINVGFQIFPREIKFKNVCQTKHIVKYKKERPNAITILNTLSNWILVWLRFGLWFLTPLSTLFQLYRNGHFYWWKPEYPEKTLNYRKSLTNVIT